MKDFIQVEFIDGTLGSMSPSALALCLRQNRIRSFYRGNGRAVVGLDQIRGSDSAREYSGPERRGLH